MIFNKILLFSFYFFKTLAQIESTTADSTTIDQKDAPLVQFDEIWFPNAEIKKAKVGPSFNIQEALLVLIREDSQYMVLESEIKSLHKINDTLSGMSLFHRKTELNESINSDCFDFLEISFGFIFICRIDLQLIAYTCQEICHVSLITTIESEGCTVDVHFWPPYSIALLIESASIYIFDLKEGQLFPTESLIYQSLIQRFNQIALKDSETQPEIRTWICHQEHGTVFVFCFDSFNTYMITGQKSQLLSPRIIFSCIQNKITITRDLYYMINAGSQVNLKYHKSHKYIATYYDVIIYNSSFGFINYQLQSLNLSQIIPLYFKDIVITCSSQRLGLYKIQATRVKLLSECIQLDLKEQTLKLYDLDQVYLFRTHMAPFYNEFNLSFDPPNPQTILIEQAKQDLAGCFQFDRITYFIQRSNLWLIQISLLNASSQYRIFLSVCPQKSDEKFFYSDDTNNLISAENVVTTSEQFFLIFNQGHSILNMFGQSITFNQTIQQLYPLTKKQIRVVFHDATELLLDSDWLNRSNRFACESIRSEQHVCIIGNRLLYYLANQLSSGKYLSKLEFKFDLEIFQTIVQDYGQMVISFFNSQNLVHFTIIRDQLYLTQELDVTGFQLKLRNQIFAFLNPQQFLLLVEDQSHRNFILFYNLQNSNKPFYQYHIASSDVTINFDKIQFKLDNEIIYREIDITQIIFKFKKNIKFNDDNEINVRITYSSPILDCSMQQVVYLSSQFAKKQVQLKQGNHLKVLQAKEYTMNLPLNRWIDGPIVNIIGQNIIQRPISNMVKVLSESHLFQKSWLQIISNYYIIAIGQELIIGKIGEWEEHKFRYSFDKMKLQIRKLSQFQINGYSYLILIALDTSDAQSLTMIFLRVGTSQSFSFVKIEEIKLRGIIQVVTYLDALILLINDKLYLLQFSLQENDEVKCSYLTQLPFNYQQIAIDNDTIFSFTINEKEVIFVLFKIKIQPKRVDFQVIRESSFRLSDVIENPYISLTIKNSVEVSEFEITAQGLLLYIVAKVRSKRLFITIALNFDMVSPSMKVITSKTIASATQSFQYASKQKNKSFLLIELVDSKLYLSYFDLRSNETKVEPSQQMQLPQGQCNQIEITEKKIFIACYYLQDFSSSFYIFDFKQDYVIKITKALINISLQIIGPNNEQLITLQQRLSKTQILFLQSAILLATIVCYLCYFDKKSKIQREEKYGHLKRIMKPKL